MSISWVDDAQLASGIAAVVALGLSARSLSVARRTPMAESYVHAWGEIVDVVVDASQTGPGPVDREDADRLLRRFHSADHRLDVLETALGVKGYISDHLRAQVNNLLVAVLHLDQHRENLEPLTQDLPVWVDEQVWPELRRSLPVQILLTDDILSSTPGNPRDDDDKLLRWYLPNVARDLRDRNSVYSPLAEPQYQVARLLADYHREFLTPLITRSTREALAGRRGWAGTRLWLRRLIRQRGLY